ncbi:hypothetical protein KM043_000927 [Ampulex compressa]|nr:hypothetical protein KM043_000927 [Ampulex compressa]
MAAARSRTPMEIWLYAAGQREAGGGKERAGVSECGRGGEGAKEAGEGGVRGEDNEGRMRQEGREDGEVVRGREGGRERVEGQGAGRTAGGEEDPRNVCARLRAEKAPARFVESAPDAADRAR